MTIANTATTGAPDQPERLSQPFQEQMNLEGLPVAGGGNTAETLTGNPPVADASTRRAFVPSNRERILQQLGALVLSPDFPPSAETPVGTARAPLIVHDGLRSEEIDILAGGRPQRFPVLAEIRSGACGDETSAFGILDVTALHFRNNDEASDFRFRPLDELDTEHFPCNVDPSLFALDGAPRFVALEHTTSSEHRRRALLADRVAGAISCLLELATIDPDCRQAVADLLSGAGTVRWLECLDGSSVEVSEGGPSGAHGAIVRAFIEHESASPSRLMEEIGRHLGDLSDPDVAHALPAWRHRAEAVLSNRMVLDGKVLSDDGTIPLRAAILAVVVDNVRDLAAFLYAERPAGRQVVVAAAFLIGLRTGVADLSWSRKLPYLDLLSPLLVALHHPEQTRRAEALAAFQEEPDESVSPLELVLCWRDHQIIRWTPPASSANAAPLPLAGYTTVDPEVPSVQEQTGALESADVMVSLEGPDGRAIKVTPARSADELTSLRLALREDDRLRKSKEILEAACTSGICWRVGMAADGTRALYADIPGGADDEVLEAMILKLPAALSIYLVPLKPKKRTGTAKGRTVRKDPV